ncbi:MAG: GLPGLI family protein [Dysgonamonadaceae bacterium]|jgi:GLPGLI family protein|nr:GLPGLI family protein [Dysgonamonadaceae bacterium]
MMKRTVLIALFFALNAYVLSAKITVLDTTVIRFRYEVKTVSDTLNPTDIRNELFLLQIGKNVSRYSDYKWFVVDSASAAIAKEINVDLYNIDFNGANELNLKMSEKGYPMFGTSYINIFIYTSEKKLVYIDKCAFDRYSYEETVEVPDWKLFNDTATVCGYLCRKATARFRGRDYEAWFAPDIPISLGPWKFMGLPGIILKIADSREHHQFECVAIEQPDWIDVIYKRNNMKIKTDRLTFNKKRKQHSNNPKAYLEGHPLAPESYKSPQSTPVKSIPYNPIELE